VNSVLTDIEQVITEIESCVSSPGASACLTAIVDLYRVVSEVVAALGSTQGVKAAHAAVKTATAGGALADLKAAVAAAKTAAAINWQTILAALLAVLQQVIPLL
jgi:hypothetical protein